MQDLRGILITCEHAANEVPKEYKELFTKHQELLKTHRGVDIGALRVAKSIERSFKAPLIYCPITRLLVDLNRSLHSPTLFFLPLQTAVKNYLLLRYYFPYRQQVVDAIEKGIKKHGRVLHLSIHSFTPKLHGVTRNADIGLLYDSKRKREKSYCRAVGEALRENSEYVVRYNYPYLGASDGLTTTLRKKFKEENYLGIEIEINQELALKPQNTLIQALRSAVW